MHHTQDRFTERAEHHLCLFNTIFLTGSTDFEVERQVFRSYYNDNIRLLQESTTFFLSLVTPVLRESSIEIDAVTARVKDREECISKFTRKYREGLDKEASPYSIKDWISDLIGVRVVCLYDCDI